MNLKSFLSFLFALIAIFLIFAYWFLPFNTTEFFQYSNNNNYNFSLNSSNNSMMQFYENLRYSDSNISYKISDDCEEFKKTSITDSFNTLSNLTILNFYPVQENEEISAFCSDRTRPTENGFFVAGEGGPINITKLDKFNLIQHGEITLIKESKCKVPLIGIHEILHALGFDHSENPNSVMYPTSNCNQEIGEDIINKINELYSYPSYPDLDFENVSAVMRGKFLDSNVSIRNNGFVKSNNSQVVIYADDKKVKSFDVNPMEAGYGFEISLSNIFVSKINFNEIKFEIVYSEPELEKTNNKIKLEIKK